MKIEENRFFAAFDEKSKNQIISLASRRTIPGGVRIFEEAAPSDGIYLVISGEVEIIKKVDDTREVVLTYVKPGEFFGEMGVIDNCGRSAGARTSVETELAKISATQFEVIMREASSGVALFFLRHIDEHLRKTNSRFISEVLHKEKLHAVGEIASTIIHDFKNPMTTIMVLADFIMETSSNPETKTHCGMILKQVDHMVAMAEEILDYTNGNHDMTRTRGTVNSLFAEAELLSADYLKSSNVEYSFSGCDAKVELNEKKMVRVIQNLLSNAVQAFKKPGGKVIVESGETEDGMVEIRVSDNGPGIPEEIRATVFDPFVTQGKKQGTGLGMAIVRSAVEAHDGTISFETEDDRGTTFIIRLPAAGG
jgi:signal transduction histidine kinase